MYKGLFSLRELSGRIYRRLNYSYFKPYVKEDSINDLKFRFFYGTPLAKEWYDPIPLAAKIEFEWVLSNIELNNQVIIDCGAHYGIYSVFFAIASLSSEVISVDPIDINLLITEINMRLNDKEPNLCKCVVANIDGNVNFEDVSNGRIVPSDLKLFKGVVKPSMRLPSIRKDATIVKLDIEGAEYEILPSQIDEMTQVNSWIVEVHKTKGNPQELVDLFIDRGYIVYWFNWNNNSIELYKRDSNWINHYTTIFACR